MNNYRRLQTKEPINYSKVFTVLGVCFCAFSILPMYFSIALQEIFLAVIFCGMFASGGIMIAYASIFKGDI
tara:strand:+ start:694 stop:906 length:213 start_codon:yes stop_codon:yes gene_type:complete